ncbi:ARL14 effector protein-like [Rhopilema esculentum]|uniref:ARL14 effector protein-like n=1 Tax=Rhopilema esculentum TaxID=499914 RepID=UPI0031CF78D0
MCSVGKKMGDPCHKLTFSRKVGSKRLDSIDCDVRELIFWRSGLSLINKDADICLHHEQLLIKRYSLAQKTCCNPFQIHKKAAKGGLKEIKLSNAKDLVTRGFDVVPGQKLCPSCTIRMNETKNDPIHAAEPDEAFEEDFDKGSFHVKEGQNKQLCHPSPQNWLIFCVNMGKYGINTN